jgi:hypothetical protein
MDTLEEETAQQEDLPRRRDGRLMVDRAAGRRDYAVRRRPCWIQLLALGRLLLLRRSGRERRNGWDRRARAVRLMFRP